MKCLHVEWLKEPWDPSHLFIYDVTIERYHKSHTKIEVSKIHICHVWVRNFVWHFKGDLWNFIQHIDALHRKIWILREVKSLTNYDILELCHLNSLWDGSLFLLCSDVCRPKNWSDWVFLRSWWRHQVETFSALLDLCEGNPSVTGGFPSQSQWRGALMFSLICVWTNGWTNNRDTGDLRRHRANYDVIVVMFDTRCVIDKLTHVYGSVYTLKCCLIGSPLCKWY